MLALGLSFLPLGGEQKGGRPEFGLAELVVNAPVSSLAPLLGTDSDGVIALLAAKGVTATPDQTLTQLAGGETAPASALLVSLTN